MGIATNFEINYLFDKPYYYWLFLCGNMKDEAWEEGAGKGLKLISLSISLLVELTRVLQSINT